MTKGEKLYRARKEKGYTRIEVANLTEINDKLIFKYEKDIITNIPFDNLETLCNLYGINPAFVVGWQDQPFDVFSIPGIMPLKTKKVPLLGTIAAGKPILAEENEEDYIECENGINADFCLKIKGESMSPRIKDGDVVFIHSQPDVENGEIAAVIIDDEATLKRVYKKGESIQLIAENPDYDPIICNSDNCENIQILGRAIALRRSLK